MSTICDIDDTLLRKGIYPIQNVIDAVNQMQPLILVTGRNESQRARTVDALKAAGVRYQKLLMVPDTINTPDGRDKYKAKIAASIPDAAVAIDNDAKVRGLYKKLGIPKVLDPSKM